MALLTVMQRIMVVQYKLTTEQLQFLEELSKMEMQQMVELYIWEMELLK
jgi:hypothetical protein